MPRIPCSSCPELATRYVSKNGDGRYYCEICYEKKAPSGTEVVFKDDRYGVFECCRSPGSFVEHGGVVVRCEVCGRQTRPRSSDLGAYTEFFRDLREARTPKPEVVNWEDVF